MKKLFKIGLGMLAITGYLIALENHNNAIANDYIPLEIPVIEQIITEEELVERIELTNDTYPLPTKTSFKTYMGYQAITNRNSKQWAMQQKAVTNTDGIREYDGRIMIAVGTYWAKECGIKLDVQLENGYIIECIVGDIKQDIHTNSTNQYVSSNGNVIEFIVDTSKINSMSKKMGDMSYSDYFGNVTKIYQVL